MWNSFFDIYSEKLVYVAGLRKYHYISMYFSLHIPYCIVFVIKRLYFLTNALRNLFWFVYWN